MDVFEKLRESGAAEVEGVLSPKEVGDLLGSLEPLLGDSTRRRGVYGARNLLKLEPIKSFVRYRHSADLRGRSSDLERSR